MIRRARRRRLRSSGGCSWERYGTCSCGRAWRSNGNGWRIINAEVIAMALPGVENYTTTTADGIEVELARYRGGAKGPVMVVHGAGVWSGMFLLPTIEEHFTQYLVNHGYDVWLLDWRASIRLPLRQFNLDQAAENDFPAALAFIRERTRAESVQAVVHCAGSSAFFMALAAGYLTQVRCVACSQIAL